MTCCSWCRKEEDVSKEITYRIPKTQEQRQAFLERLDRASKIVESWPKWKQNLLGRSASEAKCQNIASKKI